MAVFDRGSETERARHHEALARLQRQVFRCRLCPRLAAWRERVAREKVRRFKNEQYWGRPVPSFGPSDAALMIVGLAPAAHGANRTGRLFTGDRSGEWLYAALHGFGFADRPVSSHRDDGLTLRGCYITAAVRCAPPANKPTAQELLNCRRFLRRELQLLLSKRVVVVLGKIAFDAFLAAWKEVGGCLPSGRTVRFRHSAECEFPGGPILLASYHPSQQNTQTGRLTRGMFHDIFNRARQILDER